MLIVDPKPKFELSPYLYMQFMEPLGTTDSSVEAGWDFENDCWREDLIEVTRELAPTMVRWGGCFASYYRWREGVGPRDERVPMYNLCWDGIETNQVGTHEFVQFCRLVGAEPLMCVNFESDGRKHWGNHPKAGIRSAGPDEAREWVDYCNNPDNEERKRNGAKEPLTINFWQIGNETSYDKNGFDCETSAKRTVVFAKEMRKADPDIKLMGWGDSGWAKRLLEVAGEHIDYVAFHSHLGIVSPDSPLQGTEYWKDPDLTWEHLMTAYKVSAEAIAKIREETKGYDVPLVMTEGHFTLRGRNRCGILSSWGAGVADARALNEYERNGDVLKVATLADFFGNRWQVNAIMLLTPKRPNGAYMMPVARIMSLYRKHVGERFIETTSVPDYLDVSSSIKGNAVFLHVVNTNRTQSVKAKLEVKGMKVKSGKVFEIADDPMREIDETCMDIFAPVEKKLPDDAVWTFPAASVTAVELEVEKGK